jgi:hypothetical protein
MGAGKALGPADTDQRVFAGFFVHKVNYTPQIGLFLSCDNLTNGKKS